MASTDMSPPSTTLKQPGDSDACQGRGSPLQVPILAFSFSTQMKGIKLGPIRDLEIKIVPKGPSMARIGGSAEGPQMLLCWNFPSNHGAPGIRHPWHEERPQPRSAGSAVRSHRQTSALALLNPDRTPLRAYPAFTEQSREGLQLEAGLG